LTPRTSSDRVVVLDLLAGDFIPLWTLRVEVIDVETIKVPDNTSLAGRVEGGTSELLNFFVL
jgi:hypothetical protein